MNQEQALFLGGRTITLLVMIRTCWAFWRCRKPRQCDGTLYQPTSTTKYDKLTWPILRRWWPSRYWQLYDPVPPFKNPWKSFLVHYSTTVLFYQLSFLFVTSRPCLCQSGPRASSHETLFNHLYLAISSTCHIITRPLQAGGRMRSKRAWIVETRRIWGNPRPRYRPHCILARNYHDLQMWRVFSNQR